MRKLLNTLYVTTPEAYLALDGENVLVLKDDNVALRVPLHNLEAIVAFGSSCPGTFAGALPAW
jgi:CRISPR-associated protein Cas1